MRTVWSLCDSGPGISRVFLSPHGPLSRLLIHAGTSGLSSVLGSADTCCRSVVAAGGVRIPSRVCLRPVSSPITFKRVLDSAVYPCTKEDAEDAEPTEPLSLCRPGNSRLGQPQLLAREPALESETFHSSSRRIARHPSSPGPTVPQRAHGTRHDLRSIPDVSYPFGAVRAECWR